MFNSNYSNAFFQPIKDTILKDTIYVNDESFESPASYSSRDSIYIDVKKNQIHLYGDAHVLYEGINMKAGYILIDLDKNEITASYRFDKDSNKVELAEFTDGDDKMIASRLRVNTDTKKVYIEEAKIQQSEAYIYMEVGKRHSNEEVHFKNGRFTTCDLEDPHFHFQLSRAIMIPEKKIVTGPMNLWIRGIPTPFGLPFSVIPQSKTRTHGFIFPNIVPMSEYGFGVQDLGYYTPINNRLQTTNYITLYNRGSFGLKNHTDYQSIYKFNGNFDFTAQKLFAGFPSKKSDNNVTLKWIHNSDPKSNPFWKFNSNVNFVSNNSSKSNLYQQNNSNYFTNQYNSDVNINRNFPGKPYSASAKLSFKQNTQTKMMYLTSPVFNFNVNRFFPFKNIFKESNTEFRQVISRIGVVYQINMTNQSNFNDSLLKNSDWNNINNNFLRGASQSISIQTTAGLFKNKFKLTPSIDYKTYLNDNQMRRSFQTINTKDTLVSTILNKTGYSQSISFSANLTTTIYSYYRFIGKSKPLLRHILTPNISYAQAPNLNSTYAYVDTIGRTIFYSPFEKSLYTNYLYQSSGTINFGLSNTFELKKISSKDSTGFKKFKLVEQFSINGNYNIFKDSMKLSDFTLAFRSNPFKAISFVSSANFSPYYWTEKGNIINKYALKETGRLGRYKEVQFSTTYTLASKESLKKIESNSPNPSGNGTSNWNSDYQYFSLHPEQIVDFTIPWKANITHIYKLSLKDSSIRSYTPVNTLMINGDISFTKRWKISGTTNIDLKYMKIVNTRLELTRDMHCWGLSFMWVPTGLNRYFQFRIFATGSMLSGLEQKFTKPPLFF